jgi:hypothetical protein
LVFRWLDRRLKGKTLALPRRFASEIDTYINIAESDDSLRYRYAAAVLLHFYEREKSSEVVDPRVLDFLERARTRYYAAPKGNMAKALGMTRSRPGNPGPSAAPRQMTPEAKIEAREEVRTRSGKGKKGKRGKPEGVAVAEVAKIFGVSPRSIRG